MKKKKALIELAVIGVLLLGIALLAVMDDNDKPVSSAEMLQAGKKCYAAGDWAGAIQHLRLYCQSVSDDPDARILLGDSYRANGQQEHANEAYQQAALLQPSAPNVLSGQQKTLTLSGSMAQLTIRIEPAVRYTRGMTLRFAGSSENLAPALRVSGRINRAKEQLIDDAACRTTAWFPVHSEMKHLFLTGNFNCAVWQFRDARGNIRLVDHGHQHLSLSTVRFSSPSYDTAAIPEDAVDARVTYWNDTIMNAATNNDQIVIGYGMQPAGRSAAEKYTYVIPDLMEGQYILYEQEQWQLWDGAHWKRLEWNTPPASAGTLLSIGGKLCGKVTISYAESAAEPQKAAEQEYGIRFDTASGVSVGERLGAARGLRFNCPIAGSWLHNGRNDFDNAYPWSGIRRCSIAVDSNGSSTIIYEGEPGFSLDGSSGNVMVEIPKFYVKRIASDSFEEIWVSGYPHTGYQLEPVFLGADGQELDHVYIAAYMGAEKDDRIVSLANMYPTLQLSYGDTLRMAENNGAGFSEASFMLYSALQKLFLVETGTLDSSSVFAGDTQQCYFYHVEDVTKSCLAAEDAQHTNTVVLYDNYNTEKLVRGASIALLTDWAAYDNRTAIRREIVSIARRDGKVFLTFDGDPVDIAAGATAVSGIPARTGKTEDLEYHTGVVLANDGCSSFRYRGIENLYGSALVMLDDDAYMQDGAFWYESSNGRVIRLNVPVAAQSTDLSNYNSVNDSGCIRTMTYDAENPTIMLPAAVGGGASVHTGYGDFWMWSNPQERRYFLYGGAGDNCKAAGLFQYRAIVYSTQTAHSFYSARIMYRH